MIYNDIQELALYKHLSTEFFLGVQKQASPSFRLDNA
jgi:hypothetical protein